MQRRTFLRGCAAGAAGLLPAIADARQTEVPERDRFGGWTGRTFAASGFFRVEKDERWWIVTPEGNAFLSFGINHLHPDLWQQKHNRSIWKQKLGIDSFDYREFTPALRTWFLKTCDEYGFNTVGVHTSLPVVNKPAPVMPYMQPIRFLDIPHWRPEVPDENFRDVFAPEFAAHCDRLAKPIAETARDDPFLLGYSMTDCPLFTEEDCRERPDVIGGARRKSRIGFPRRLRNLGGESAGKRAYVQAMRDLYRDSIDDFNSTYSTQFDSFAALASARDWRSQTSLWNANETRDNVAFLQRVVAKYYETTRDAIRRYDTNHMFVGDKLNGNTDTVDTILPVTSRYTDLVMYQMYGRYEVQRPGLDRWSRIVDKPFINGDAAFTMVTDTMPRPYGPIADSLQQRVDWTVEFFQNAFARPDFVGWHYCGLIDASQRIPRKRDRQHSGLFDDFAVAYPALQKAISACALEMYQIAIGSV